MLSGLLFLALAVVSKTLSKSIYQLSGVFRARMLSGLLFLVLAVVTKASGDEIPIDDCGKLSLDSLVNK